MVHVSALNTWTRAGLEAALNGVTARDAALIRSWLSAAIVAGLGVAIYQNRDLSSEAVGNRKFLSYGLDDSTFVSAADLPPTFPDAGTTINWAYTLEAVYPPAHERLDD